MKSISKSILNKEAGLPLIISGPCSAETEKQVIATSHALKATGYVDILRAGIWKPRTRPGSFEGVGTKGLPWLQKAKELTGLPVAVEVATARQVEDVLHFGMDVVWIGARTTANPFSVQEVANALKGVDIPVLVKNPTNPDIDLWMGAVERLSNAGLQHLGLIHRGFSSCNAGEYRNAPMWQLAMEMKSKNPEMIMLNDPSHISGKRNGLAQIMRKAIDLSFDGFIIESHIDPENAWSDADQQVTPKMLKDLLDAVKAQTIVCRFGGYSSEDFLIQQINQLEDELRIINNKRNGAVTQLKVKSDIHDGKVPGRR